MTKRRLLEVVVISDVHLGTYGSAADELVIYLKSIQPKTLVLNGDIIDIWQFNKRYFPQSHLKVIREIFNLAALGAEVYYITGNHDEALRRFSGFSIGNIHLVNKLVLKLPSGTAWFFHGDVFDYSIKHSKWIAKLGGKGYDLLILFNTFVNWCLIKMGRERVSISKRVKDKVKGIISFVNDFENKVAQIAIEKQYNYVICGHIHQPRIKEVSNEQGQKTVYLNSGDWVENHTSLEYINNEWSIFSFVPSAEDHSEADLPIQAKSIDFSMILEPNEIP